MVLILSDSDVARSCTASRAIAVIRKAIHAHGEGRLAAPPRAHSELAPSSRVTFTAGALEGLVYGVRIYDNTDSAEQVVAVWDASTGRLAALVLGAELGRRRTGAIGAVAMDTLARPEAATLGVIGTGHQAWAQVWAATSIRMWRRIQVFGRNSYVRERFAARCREQLLVDAVPVDYREAAVRGMDAVIVATNSSVPVFETSWLEPGSHVTTLGPKTISAHEVPLDLLDRVELVVTDSLAQVHGHREPNALSTRRMVELGAIMTGAVPGRTREDQITLFCSVGLSGTEVVLAADLSGLPTGPAPAMTAALPVIPHAGRELEAQPPADLVGAGANAGGMGFHGTGAVHADDRATLDVDTGSAEAVVRDGAGDAPEEDTGEAADGQPEPGDADEMLLPPRMDERPRDDDLRADDDEDRLREVAVGVRDRSHDEQEDRSHDEQEDQLGEDDQEDTVGDGESLELRSGSADFRLDLARSASSGDNADSEHGSDDGADDSGDFDSRTDGEGAPSEDELARIGDDIVRTENATGDAVGADDHDDADDADDADDMDDTDAGLALVLGADTEESRSAPVSPDSDAVDREVDAASAPHDADDSPDTDGAATASASTEADASSPDTDGSDSPETDESSSDSRNVVTVGADSDDGADGKQTGRRVPKPRGKA